MTTSMPGINSRPTLKTNSFRSLASPVPFTKEEFPAKGACSFRLIFREMWLLPHLRQGPAVPDSDGDSAQSCGGSEQEAGAPEIPLFRGGWNPAGCLIDGNGFSAKRSQFSKWHGDLGKTIEGGPWRNLFFESPSMVVKGEI